MTKTHLSALLFFSFLLVQTPAFTQAPPNLLELKVQKAREKQRFPVITPFTFFGNADSWPGVRGELDRASLLRLKTSVLSTAYRTGADVLTLELPSENGSPVLLDLIREKVLADGFAVRTSSGKGQSTFYQPGLHYRGIVRGEVGSSAALSIYEDGLMGVVNSANTGPAVLGRMEGERELYVFYFEKDLLSTLDFECHADAPAMKKLDLKKLKPHLQGEKSVSNCVNAYLECEHDMFLEHGSVSATVNYLLGLFNAVATLYQNESVTMQVSEVFVWDTPDAYPTSSSIDALNAFRTTRPGYNGDIAHLVSRGAPANGGVAWLDALCTGYAYGYSYIFSTYQQLPAYSWSVEVITHEMGHNLGSPHTHACAWNANNTALDGCGPAAGYSEGCNGPLPNKGTIMSYCHLLSGVGIDFNLGFGTQPGNLIRNKVASASCLSSCSPGCNMLLEVTGTPANDGDNGTALAAPSNGTEPYTYLWSNSGTSSQITGLAPGTYTVAVTDLNGCTNSGSYVVEDQNPCVANGITLTITMDNYPEETSWEIANNEGVVVASSGGTYANQGDSATVTYTICLPDGCYTFTIYDAYGDGICCVYGQGAYSLTENSLGNTLANGSSFEFSESTSFCLPSENGGGETGCTYALLHHDSFESGWGIWNDGGADCWRANSTSYANSGKFSIRLRDNDPNSSHTTTDALDLSQAEEVTLAFSYVAVSMDNAQEDFWLQMSTDGGVTFATVEEWNLNDEFVNNVRYNDTVIIAGPFSSDTRLRFRCDASGNSDWVYLDDVSISACLNGGNFQQGGDEKAVVLRSDHSIDPLPASGATLRLFPNPATTGITIEHNLQGVVTLRISDLTGRTIRSQVLLSPEGATRLDLGQLQAGYYIVHLSNGRQSISEKLIVLK